MKDLSGREIRYGDEVTVGGYRYGLLIAKVIGAYNGRIALVKVDPTTKQDIPNAKPWWYQGHKDMILITQREI